MHSNPRRIGAVVVASTLLLAAGSAHAQIYGGGYWGGLAGGQTPQGSFAKGAGMYALGAGQYNVDTAQARAINANTAAQWNQYIYNSRVQAAQIYRAKNSRDQAREKGDYNAIQARLRFNPNQIDLTNGNALDVALDDLTAPNVFDKAIYYGGKMKIGGDAIRDIPFVYASAGISTSVHQLTEGPAPAPLQRDEFGPDRDKLKAIAAELRKEGEELGSPKPETIKKVKAQLMATKAKVEAMYPQASQERRDAEKYIKSLNGLASMLETPAINVILAGVEKRPEASVGDLLGFMMAYNLRFGPSETVRQREIYMSLYPMFARLREDALPLPGTAAPASPTAPAAPAVVGDAPGAVFEGRGYDHKPNGTPPPPVAAPN